MIANLLFSGFIKEESSSALLHKLRHKKEHGASRAGCKSRDKLSKDKEKKDIHKDLG